MLKDNFVKKVIGKFWQKDTPQVDSSLVNPSSKHGVTIEAKTMATKRTNTPGKDAKKPTAKKSTSAPKKAAVSGKATTPAAKTPVQKIAASKAPVVKKESAKPAPAAKTTAPRKESNKSPVAKIAPVKTPAKGSPSKTATKERAPVVSLRMAPKKPVKGKGGLAGGIRPYQSKKGENYMNDAQKAHFRSLLLAWKSELMEEVDRTVSHMKDEAANFPDPADRATQEEEFSLELRARDRERKLIKKIDSTLELIEQDDYGYCEACGIEIGVQRLEARPTATQCIDCKTLAEIKEKQLGA